MASSSSSTVSSSSPCAACKFLRRKCMPGCIFAPYFPPEEPQKFANVHKIFGASNVTKLLNELHPHQREDAVNSLAYEAEARMKDPVYGCVGAISVLQRQVHRLQKELDAANADLLRYACNDFPQPPPAATPHHHHHHHHHHQRSFPALPTAIPGGPIHPNSRQRSFELGRRSSFGQFHGASTAADGTHGFPFSYPPSWAGMNNPSPGDQHMDGGGGGGGGGDGSNTM